ncbi:hypothetical protein AB8A05_04285 [Tardiphaga sp. 538_B7_N1_4]|jgi:hypothetical protein|uniref:hypothetical protein n=1 Tax=Tardiphaga sp. 538_B7_N1_4 TaxID=3240778 RepID=UPI003F2843C3
MEQDFGAALNNDKKPTKLQLAWKETKWRLYLLYCRWGYRHVSRVSHRLGFHQMKRLHPMGGNVFYRCDWCGMHGTRVESRSSAFLE